MNSTLVAGYPSWRRRLSPWSVGSGLLLAVLLVPVFVVAFSFLGETPATWQHIRETVLGRYITTTLLLTSGVAICTCLTGVTCAWLVTFYRFPGDRLLSWALVLPFAIPTYIAAYCYADLFQHGAPLDRMLQAIGLPHIDIMTLPGAVLVLSSVLFPYVYLITRSAFQGHSERILDASRALGRGPFFTAARLGIPLARPAIAGGLTLVTMEVLNEYGAVHYFGVDTFTTGIFKFWFTMDDTGGAMRLAASLMAVVLAVLMLERLQRGKRRFATCDSAYRPSVRRPLPTGLGWAATAVCAIPVIAGFALPLGQLLSWLRTSGSEALAHNFGRLVLQSFAVAGAAALLTVVVATIVAYTVRLHRSKLITTCSRVSALGYSMPGAIVAIGIMVSCAALDRGLLQRALAPFGVSGLILTGSFLALIGAYVLRYLTVAVNPIEAGFQRCCGCLDEASRALGRSPMRTLLQVNLPLARNTLIAGGLLVFVDVLKELPLTLILRPFNFETLATKTYQLAGEEMIAQSAVGALLMVAVGLVPVLWVDHLLRNKKA